MAAVAAKMAMGAAKRTAKRIGKRAATSVTKKAASAGSNVLRKTKAVPGSIGKKSSSNSIVSSRHSRAGSGYSTQKGPRAGSGYSTQKAPTSKYDVPRPGSNRINPTYDTPRSWGSPGSMLSSSHPRGTSIAQNRIGRPPDMKTGPRPSSQPGSMANRPLPDIPDPKKSSIGQMPYDLDDNDLYGGYDLPKVNSSGKGPGKWARTKSTMSSIASKAKSVAPTVAKGAVLAGGAAALANRSAGTNQNQTVYVNSGGALPSSTTDQEYLY